jgi:hypothetical protein
MLIPTINCLNKQITLTYPHLPDFELKMNFDPIIERFQLTGKFCLLHWQAKPFGLRRWGLYDAGIDQYFATTWDCIDIKCNAIPLQLDETIIKTVPTAVLYFKDCKAINQNYLSIVRC